MNELFDPFKIQFFCQNSTWQWCQKMADKTLFHFSFDHFGVKLKLWRLWKRVSDGFVFTRKKFFLPTVAVAVQHTGLDWGTGRQNGGIATDALARSIHNRVSRLISPKKVDLLLNVDIVYSISEYYLARHFLFHL